MKIYFHDSFAKAYTKRIKNNTKLSAKTQQKVRLFKIDPKHPSLKDHALSGTKKGFRSFWITGDHRVVYKLLSNTEVVLVDIGTHNQVY